MSRKSPHCLAIVLAAGEGTRMKSRRAKVMHEIAGRPMLGHVLAAVAASGASSQAVVVGPGHDDAADLARHAGAAVFVQTERRGTAHAVLAAREALAAESDVVVVAFGDTPLVSPATFGRLIAAIRDGAAVAALGFEAADPTGYGRLIERDGELVAIREHRDASDEERTIRLCNAGLMALDGSRALTLLDAIGDANSQGEFYLTDVVEVARRQGLKAVALVADEAEVQGVNDRVQLARAEATLQARLREAAMRSGATLVAPETVFFSHDTVLGRDVVVEPHVVFGPAVVVGDGATIHAFSHLAGAVVESGASVGPYGRLRPGAVLRSGAKVGNFVEVKNAEIGPGAKLPHLTYVGDASVGPKANVGAGTITCNYDGFNKSRTVIGEGAFVGSNSSLVAPVTIGAGAIVGSGSVITEDVPDDALAVGRGRQVIKAGWAAAFRARPENQKKKK